VPRPIGEEMQRRPPASLGTLDHAPGEPGIGGKQSSELLDIALLEGRCEFSGKLFVASKSEGLRGSSHDVPLRGERGPSVDTKPKNLRPTVRAFVTPRQAGPLADPTYRAALLRYSPSFPLDCFKRW
jgi:hypothetical protein